jgi:hypothetical protein
VYYFQKLAYILTASINYKNGSIMNEKKYLISSIFRVQINRKYVTQPQTKPKHTHINTNKHRFTMKMLRLGPATNQSLRFEPNTYKQRKMESEKNFKRGRESFGINGDE